MSRKKPANHTVEPALQRLTVKPALALEFFAVFSRFEFALKVTQFRKNYNGETWADWKKFAEAIAKDFDTKAPHDPEVRQAFDYLTTRRLGKLVVQDNGPMWQDVILRPNLSNADRALSLIKQVRNNFFHGGKYAPDSDAPPERDEQLLKNAIVLLRVCLSLETSVKEAYEK
ncbi:MAG TPA: hypothetical protein VHE58_00475 [Burkholderiales bacterium]|nr:hypothetical protein [Burkholderiales bacterium]